MWAKISLEAKRSKNSVSYLFYKLSNNSKMLTVALARIGHIFPENFSEKYIFLIFNDIKGNTEMLTSS